MVLKFPDVDRIELLNPPLELVVCQVRFPVVLALTQAGPVAMQGKLSKRYPITKERSEMIQNALDRPPEIQKSWLFSDTSDTWTVCLGRDSFALETKAYTRFSEFKSRFLETLSVVRELYPVSLCERVGLRYIDHISKDRCPELPDGWPTRLPSGILPLRELRQDEPQLSRLESRFTMLDQTRLTVRTLYVDEGLDGNKVDKLVLDFDSYTEERTAFEQLDGLLDAFKAVCYRAFRWALGNLIDAFERKEAQQE